MNNVINILANKKENVHLVVLDDNIRVGLTLDFIMSKSSKQLKAFHKLPVVMYLDFKDVTVVSLDYFIRNDTDYANLLNKYLT